MKAYVNVTTRLIVETENKEQIYQVLENMDYNYETDIKGTKILDTEIRDQEILHIKEN